MAYYYPSPKIPNLKSQMAQGKNWCFTINNYTDWDEVNLQSLDCSYLVYGREVAPTTGTKHLQGFIVFDTNKRANAVFKLLPGAHVEKTKGQAIQASTYCKKEGDFFESGKHPMTQKEKGEKGDEYYRSVIASAKAGTLEETHPKEYWLNHRTALQIQAAHRPSPLDLECLPGIWIYGPAGSGKSRKARKDYPDAYLKKADTIWWCGYNYQDHVIIDDFDKFMVKQGHNLKIWLDRYSFPAEVKGSSMRIRPKIVVVTSQYHPADIWTDDETQAAILRRCLLIYMENGHPVVAPPRPSWK